MEQLPHLEAVISQGCSGILAIRKGMLIASMRVVELQEDTGRTMPTKIIRNPLQGQALTLQQMHWSFRTFSA